MIFLDLPVSLIYGDSHPPVVVGGSETMPRIGWSIMWVLVILWKVGNWSRNGCGLIVGKKVL